MEIRVHTCIARGECAGDRAEERERKCVMRVMREREREREGSSRRNY